MNTEQMVEVDRVMMEDLGIDLIQMMENAGRNLAQLARRRFLDGDARGKTVLVLAGAGGNGGGALVCARRLFTWGADVQVLTSRPFAEFAPVPQHQLSSLEAMAVGVEYGGLPSEDSAPDLVIDGLIGYSLSGSPRGVAADLIRWANTSASPVLSLDVPSGFDAATGTVLGPAIRAAATMTLALPKTGLERADASLFVGELYLADLSVPPSAYLGLGLEVGPLFARGEIVRLPSPGSAAGP